MKQLLLDKIKKYYPGFNENYQFIMTGEVEKIEQDKKLSLKEKITNSEAIIDDIVSYQPSLDIYYNPTRIITDLGKVDRDYLALFWEKEYLFIEKFILDSGINLSFGDPYEKDCCITILYNLSEKNKLEFHEIYDQNDTVDNKGNAKMIIFSSSIRLTGEEPEVGFELDIPSEYGEQKSISQID